MAAIAIARRHLIPKAAIADGGLESLGITLSDGALLKLIREYANEAWPKSRRLAGL